MEKLVFFIKAKRYERNKASPYLQGSNMHFPYSREPLSANPSRGNGGYMVTIETSHSLLKDVKTRIERN